MQKTIILSFIILFYVLNPSILAAKTLQKPPVSVKDEHGFWVNDEESALKEATKSKKPILIDFYGIWCPPCNQLDELVYSTTEFKKTAKKFVLLKMDADSEKSWLLKSKYNIGGYPTLIMAKVDDNQAGNEIDRVVGYYPTEVITAKMNEALISDGKSNDEKIKALIEKSIQQAQENADNKTALSYINAGLILDPDNLKLKLSQIKIQSLDKPEITNTKDAQKILNDVVTRRKEMPVSTLNEHFEIKPSKEILNELLSRVNPSTLFIDNEGFTEADIYAMGIDLAEKEKNDQSKKIYTEMTIESYEKLLKKYGTDSRSLNLSYTYYLQKDGNFTKAQDVYKRMIQKYPQEFTFYYQAAQMGLEMKDYTLAKKYANQALDYAYGDNKIRSMDRLVKIAIAQADKTDLKNTIEKAEDFIKASQKSGELKVRTDRYLKKLSSTVEEAKKLI